MTLMLLPAGVVSGVPIKTIFFALSSFFTMRAALTGTIRIPPTAIYLFIAANSVFFTMALVGVLAGNEYAFAELKYLSTAALTTTLLSIYAINNPESFQRAIIVGTFLYSIFKLSLVFSASNLVSIYQLEAIYSHIFSQKFVHMPITGDIHRIQLPPDILYAMTPILYLLLRCSTGRPAGIQSLAFMIICSAIISFTAYSRLIFLVFSLSTILCIHMSIRSKLTAILLLSLLPTTLLLLNFDVILHNSFFEERFSARNNYHSDSIRETQIAHLIAMWLDSPIYGHGLGAYIASFVRDPEIPFSYEAQLIAYAMKGGLLFIVSFSVSIFYFSYKLISNAGLTPAVLFLTLMAAGFTNPYLTSTATTVLYASFFLLAWLSKKNHPLTSSPTQSTKTLENQQQRHSKP
tara:strand:- start:2595 stop:3809 length:1215 start_codon:yes stop_codon:yes gene_type:complete